MKYKVTLSTKHLRLYGKELEVGFKTYETAYNCFLKLVNDNKNSTAKPIITLLEDNNIVCVWRSHNENN